jgi:hypothetical protein
MNLQAESQVINKKKGSGKPAVTRKLEGAGYNFTSDRCELHRRFIAFDKLGAELRFEGAKLLAERGLGDVNGICGPPEVSVFRNGDQIFKLAKSRHDRNYLLKIGAYCKLINQSMIPICNLRSTGDTNV